MTATFHVGDAIEVSQRWAMNPGLSPALCVELGHRAVIELMTLADKVELICRLDPVPDDWFVIALASHL